MTVRKATQFMVNVDDRPGMLAEVTGRLAEAGVNLVSLAGWSEGGGRATIACVPDDPDKVRSLAADAGVAVKETEVVVAEGEDKLGVAHALAQKIADAGVNIKDCMIQAAGGKYQAVIHVCQEDVDKVVGALADCGCSCSCS